MKDANLSHSSENLLLNSQILFIIRMVELLLQIWVGDKASMRARSEARHTAQCSDLENH